MKLLIRFRMCKGWLRPLHTGDRYMQVNLTVNIRDDIWEVVISNRYTQGDRYIQSRYIQVYTGLTVVAVWLAEL